MILDNIRQYKFEIVSTLNLRAILMNVSGKLSSCRSFDYNKKSKHTDEIRYNAMNTFDANAACVFFSNTCSHESKSPSFQNNFAGLG